MIRVERQINIESATAREVFVELSDPHGLSTLIPRLRKATLEESSDERARLTLCISIGSMFGTICFAGNLSWTEPEEIVFQVAKPIDAKIRWTLTPKEHGTNVKVTATMNLAPLLGPMAMFVPQDIVQDIIGSELEHALRQVASRFEMCALPESSYAFQPVTVAV